MTEMSQANQKKNYTLEACQINELKGQMIVDGSGSTSANAPGDGSPVGEEANGSDGMAELRKRLRAAKEKLSHQLQQKLPQPTVSKKEQQGFSFLSKMRQMYSASAMVEAAKEPSLVDIYELAIKEKFRQVGKAAGEAAEEGTRRLKYWGELKDCVSQH